MGGEKGNSPSALVPPVLDKGVRWLMGPGRPVGLLLLIAAVFFGAWYLVWRSVGPWLLGQKDYVLTLEDIEITPPPEWVRGNDIRAEAFYYGSLDGQLSITDEKLVERVKEAFALHPWVAKVVSVRKRHPAGIKVELVYRRPACMVQVGEGKEASLIPVDVEGVVLPGDQFSPAETRRYPRLTGIASRPLTSVGSRWADPRVAGGALIAATLLPTWERMGLDQIIPSAGPSTAAADCRFELMTRQGTWINWGRPPSGELPGERTAAEKVAELEKYFKENGTLEGPAGPQQLDLTRPGSIELPRRSVGTP